MIFLPRVTLRKLNQDNVDLNATETLFLWDAGNPAIHFLNVWSLQLDSTQFSQHISKSSTVRSLSAKAYTVVIHYFTLLLPVFYSGLQIPQPSNLHLYRNITHTHMQNDHHCITVKVVVKISHHSQQILLLKIHHSCLQY